MNLSCFVYYRVAPDAPADVPRAVGAMQELVRRESGVAGRLLRRADDSSTWMEIYEGVADWPSFEAALERIVRDRGIDRLLAPGEKRHVERFVPCA